MKVRDDIQMNPSARPESPGNSFDSTRQRARAGAVSLELEFAPGEETYFTPKEAATYLRVSKSYLDKLRVYGGGPQFLRPGKRKIIYRKPHLDVWVAERTFTSTSEYDDPARDQSDCMSNNKKEHPAR